MRIALAVVGAAQAVVCLAQAQTGNLALKIPPVQTSVDLGGQSVGISAWGDVSAAPSGNYRVAVTVDLGGFQENLTPVLSARLNRSDRCGERLTVEHATISPAGPSGLLTANIHFERYGCAKAFGKEIVKRLVGGNARVEVILTPSIDENRIRLTAEVRKVDADGSLGEALRSGSFGDSMREKIALSIEAAVQKSADLKHTLPGAFDGALALQSVQFDDGGSGRLWLTIAGEVRLSPEQFHAMAKTLAH